MKEHPASIQHLSLCTGKARTVHKLVAWSMNFVWCCSRFCTSLIQVGIELHRVDYPTYKVALPALDPAAAAR